MERTSMKRSAIRTLGRSTGLLALSVLLGALAPGATGQDGTEPAERPVNVDDLLDWGDEPVERPNRIQRVQPEPIEVVEADDPMIQFDAFAEAAELTTLIDFVGATLGLNIVVKGSPSGEIMFNAPIGVPKSKLLDLLDAMLEQYSFTITSEDETGFYIVQPITDVRPSVGGDRPSVRIIPTPNIKPSLIAPVLSAAVGSAPANPQGGGSQAIQAVDELGVLIVSAPSRDIARVESMIEQLMRIDADQQYIRFELTHIAAPAALERAVGLVGGSSGGGGGLGAALQTLNRRQAELQGGAASTGISGGTLSNLADRITIDPQGNALIFRGTTEEIDRVRDILAVIDVPNTLEPKSYFAGSSAAQIADIASRRGLGEVIQIEADSGSSGIRAELDLLSGGASGNSGGGGGGPVMVVDVERGSIIYYGTPTQQEQLADLMEELRTEDERVVLREYVLNHSDAEEIADVLTGIITGETQTGDAPLLPTSRGINRVGNRATQNAALASAAGGGGDEISAAFDPDQVTVIAYPENNMVVVRAPLKQQDELSKLIDRLDRRRSQVYIQALIVSVADNEDFTLAFETQFLAGEFGVNTNFGLGSFGDTGTFTDSKSVATGLGGLTSAIIRSDYVPLIVNATQTDSDVRILSSPQLLVNDNEEAEIVSIEEQPFTETNIGSTTDTTTFGGFAEAGTTLRVTPSISDGGFLRLEYYVELSNFTSATGTAGSPPPRNTRRVEGLATIPSDATIVVGGLTVDDIRDTVVKVPFIGDIPLIGEAFKRTNKINNKAKLYVFLTPRIMTDPNFNDLKLLTEGPQGELDLDPDAPELEPETIRSVPAGTLP